VRADLDRVACKVWWLEKHAPLVVAFPELAHYQANLVPTGAEVWFDDMDTLQRVTSSEGVREAQKHSIAHTRDRIRLFLAEHRIH
jgi:hypothetical protein